jgi:hypothetical protein
LFRPSRRPHRPVPALAAALLAACVLASTAAAERVTWPTNGHAYQVVSVPAGISWSDARAAAQAVGGHLATLGSSAENAFVFGLVDKPLYWHQEPGGSDLGPWLGGYQTSDTGNPSANWVWVTGEPWSYTSWHSGEPNNYTGAAENYLSYKCYGTSGCRSAGWNDLPDLISQYGTSVIAFVIEFELPAAVGDRVPSRDVQLLPVAPNPFAAGTQVRFELPAAADARLAIVDVAGRTVRVLAEQHLTAGAHAFAWDGRDEAGLAAAPGCYFARLTTLGTTRTVGMRLLR